MSKFSPRVVEDKESLTRFVFIPMHLAKMGKAVKPSFFDQIHTSGCSVQRDAFATNNELSTFISEFLKGDAKRAWVGVISGKCESVRNIRIGDRQERAVCVYDTAEPNNPAHSEVFCAGQVSEDADRLELRHDLWIAFSKGALTAREVYRLGAIWSVLMPEFQARP